MSIHLMDYICPQCGKTCWVNNGNIDDLTVPDVEGFICWFCDSVLYIDDYNEVIWDHDGEYHFVKSYETPREALGD